MKVYAWLIDFARFRENCPTGIIPEWMQKVTQHNEIIQKIFFQKKKFGFFQKKKFGFFQKKISFFSKKKFRFWFLIIALWNGLVLVVWGIHWVAWVGGSFFLSFFSVDVSVCEFIAFVFLFFK